LTWGARLAPLEPSGGQARDAGRCRQDAEDRGRRVAEHGDPDVGRGHAGTAARRGLALNSAHTAIIDSHFSEWKTVGEDSQAIAG
jgi:hypothetical protein